MSARACDCVYVCVHVCVRACVRAVVCHWMGVCVCVCARARAPAHYLTYTYGQDFAHYKYFNYLLLLNSKTASNNIFALLLSTKCMYIKKRKIYESA